MGKLLDATDIENAIVALLDVAAVRGTAIVEGFPERPESYVQDRMKSASGAIVIAISAFDDRPPSEGRGGFTYTIIGNVLARNLRRNGGHLGAYELMMNAINVLDTGDESRVIVSVGAERLRLRVVRGSYRTYDAENAIWQYQFQVEALQL